MRFSALAVRLLAPLGAIASQVNLYVYPFFTTYNPLAFLALSIKAPLSSAKTYNRPSADSSFDKPQPATTTQTASNMPGPPTQASAKPSVARMDPRVCSG